MKNVKLLLLPVLLSVLFISSCTKDDGEVKGQVTYIGAISGTEYYADKATVYLMTSETEYAQKTVTDANGNYSFYPVIDGLYHLEAEITVNQIDYDGSSENFLIEKDDVVSSDLVLE